MRDCVVKYLQEELVVAAGAANNNSKSGIPLCDLITNNNYIVFNHKQQLQSLTSKQQLQSIIAKKPDNFSVNVKRWVFLSL